jgi:catechol 2,3-dioxygenase-like lactoylglutathione lyase family enzyme
MFKIKRLDHVVIRTANIKEMVSFYCFTLGCVVKKDKLKEHGLIQLTAGESLIDLLDTSSELGQKSGNAPDPNARNMDHFCILLDHFDEVEIKLQLKKFGVEFSEVQMRFGATRYGPSIYIYDPDGNKVEIKGLT